MNILHTNEYVPYQMNYIKLVSEQNILKGLINQKEEMIHFFNSIPVFKQEYSYEEGKWTIKDLLLHLIDAERLLHTGLCELQETIQQLCLALMKMPLLFQQMLMNVILRAC